jgi:site-specific DNA recombinase
MSRHLAAVPDKPGRVALYVRVSALMGRSGEEFHSPDVQVGAMRRLTAGMREVAVIDDDLDQTGRTFEREGLDRIRQLAEDGHIDVLAVYNLARFGRNTMEGLRLLNWLAERGVTILSASEHVDTSTPSGRWMLTNLLAMAEMRSDEIGNEWGQVIHHRALAGKHHGRPPTGYLRGEDGRLIVDTVAGPAVARAFTAYADGAAVAAIRRELQAVTGLAVSSATLKRMLRNRAYRGVVHVGARGSAGSVEVENAHPALVDEATWDQVQERMAADRRLPPRLVNPQYSLSGLGRCAVCEGRTNIRPEHGRDKARIFCVNKWGQRLRSCTGCGTAGLEDVEAAVLEKIKAHIAKLKGDIGAQAAQLSKAQRAGIDAAAVGGELNATRRAMARATERWVRGQIDDRTYEDTMASLRAAEDRLARATVELRRAAEVPDTGKLVKLAERLVQLWPRMDGGQRNRALRDLVEAVVISPAEKQRQAVGDRVRVEWR